MSAAAKKTPEKVSEPLRIAVLVSGSGSTLQFLSDAIHAGKLPARICAVLADRLCPAAEHAAIAGLSVQVFSRKALGKDGLDQALARALTEYRSNGRPEARADLVLLAGYLSVLGPRVLKSPAGRQGRIWNMHPSLLPQYGGMGMYGIHVHRAVLEAGEQITGCTLHQVSAEVDGGAILARRSVTIADCCSAEQIAARVRQTEKQLLLEYLQSFAENGLSLGNLCF